MRPLRLGLAFAGAVITAMSSGSASSPAQAQTPSRLERVRARGALGCGIDAGVAGFAERDASGRYHGLDIDICRAIAAATLGSADKVAYLHAATLDDVRRDDRIDVVVRRLTWQLGRELPRGALFGPIVFYDGQTFLVSNALGVTTVPQLSGREICVAGGTVFEAQLNEYFAGHRLELRKLALESPHDDDAIAQALSSGRCRAYTGDQSELGAIRSRLAAPARFRILPGQISKEPLAPLVRADDPQWFAIVRWTVFALINAEELGVTSQNLDQMKSSRAVDVQRLLGVLPGNGRALGLAESWAYDAIKAVGNYGEIFERNLGASSPIKLERGLNRLAKDGGLMYAPPLR
jgi:general L-amino acid transport system substrate-binding protein